MIELDKLIAAQPSTGGHYIAVIDHGQAMAANFRDILKTLCGQIVWVDDETGNRTSAWRGKLYEANAAAEGAALKEARTELRRMKEYLAKTGERIEVAAARGRVEAYNAKRKARDDDRRVRDAAQDLLRALKRWQRFAKDNGWSDADYHDADGTGWITDMDKAIAKAEETPTPCP